MVQYTMNWTIFNELDSSSPRNGNEQWTKRCHMRSSSQTPRQSSRTSTGFWQGGDLLFVLRDQLHDPNMNFRPLYPFSNFRTLQLPHHALGAPQNSANATQKIDQKALPPFCPRLQVTAGFAKEREAKPGNSGSPSSREEHSVNTRYQRFKKYDSGNVVEDDYLDVNSEHGTQFDDELQGHGYVYSKDIDTTWEPGDVRTRETWYKSPSLNSKFIPCT